MRRVRSEEKQASGPKTPTAEPEASGPQPTPEDELPSSDEPVAAKKKKAKDGPEKKKYAEFVKMTEPEYDKLVSQFGEQFTLACIEELDNYKGAKGRTYKSDYRAILSWVVDRVREKRPGLEKASKENVQTAPQSKPANPFEKWGDEQ